jgi:hypothetical protein
MVEATGTYAELHASGLSFAKQLGLNMEVEDSQGKHQAVSCINSKLPLRKTNRQSSETSEHVILFTA